MMQGSLRALAVCLTLALATASAAQTTSPQAGPATSEISTVEKFCDGAIRGYSLDAPLDHLLPTHGTYIDGYGAVFFTDVNLVTLPPLFGFGTGITKDDISRIHEGKIKRLPAVKELLQHILLGLPNLLPHLQAEESILLHVRFYSAAFEDRSGLPSRISISGKKKDLQDIVAGKIAGQALQAALKMKAE